MARKALSQTKKAQVSREERDKLMKLAVIRYQQELAKPDGEKRDGLRTICRKVADEHFLKTKHRIPLNHNTLLNLVNGGRTKAQANFEDKSWITHEETEEVIRFAVEIANWGIPLSQRRLKEHVDHILRARLGSKFPEGGVGRNWTQQFLEKHSERLHVYSATPLDTARGQAVNETSNEMHFDLVEEVQLRGDNGKPIAPECTYAMDKIGFQPNGDEGFEKVIGATGKKLQYKQQKGTRENTTVLVTVGGHGKALNPAVIFKGKAHRVRWLQDNPSNASLGYSRKGWTSRVIFLWLDSHDSHITYEFLQYCIANNIKVTAYPKHATHIYQLLDVVLFAPLKQEFGRLRDELYRTTGEAVTKENFLKIYGQAHLNILTADLIKTGFRKVGIIPVNRNVVTPEMMAPSKDTSYKVFTPVIPSTPIRIVTDLLMDVIQPCDNREGRENIPPFPVRVAVPQLAQTELAYLVSKSPIKASTPPPDMPDIIISPVKHRGVAKQTTTHGPLTLREIELEEELQLERAKRMEMKGMAMQLQAQNVIQRIYCARVRGQLAATENKRAKKDDGGQLDENLPPLLTHEDFVKQVKRKEEATAAAQKKKENNRDRRKAYEKEKIDWQVAEALRKDRNKKREAEWKKAEAAWMVERAEVKAKRGRIKEWEVTHPKPKKNDPEWKAEDTIPKPRLHPKVAEDAGDSSGEYFDLDVSSDDEDEV
ncbi:hypothetical protein M378DRAFT_188629 [Amanita muscaria Koide BX008]|uniref:DDE-1 domain-containing protein n=1 Tax=Amanita muscaria (strain Koide BX008) TaxID=946122 RepID=A0A0C2RZT7_AMAMK|nr:hypothetical protein M378DRAFT_188629 [Amanita muscaria Koide BX008]